MSDENNKKIASTVVLAQHGNKSAYRELYLRYNKNIYFIAKTMNGINQETSKLTQEIFLRMFATIDKLPDLMEFEQWFYTLAVNMCRQHGENDDNMPSPELDAEIAGIIDSASESALNRDHFSFEHDIIRIIENIVASLPQQSRAILLYKCTAELTDEEIATIEKTDEEDISKKSTDTVNFINAKSELIKERGVSVTPFISQLPDTLLHIASTVFVPNDVYKNVSEKIGVDVNPFAPSPEEKEQLEAAAKESVKLENDKKKESNRKKGLTKGDFILFLSVLAAALLIFGGIKIYKNQKNKETTTVSTTLAAQIFDKDAAPAWNGAAATSFDAGDGTSQNPYQISNGNQLAYLANLINENKSGYGEAYYVITADIILNETENFAKWDTNPPANEWTPIGYNKSSTSYSYFMGRIDGRGHTISGMYINAGGSEYQGLFGIAKNSDISDIVLKDAYVVCGDYSGGIVGYSSYKATSVGGIDYCSFSGKIISDGSNVGGIAGYFRTEKTDAAASIKCCANLGEISAKGYVGGIAGVAESSVGTLKISNSYNAGEVIATAAFSGGITGQNRVSRGQSSIVQCYNAGKITSSAESTGAIAGENTCINSEGKAEISGCVFLNGTAVEGALNSKPSSDDESGVYADNEITENIISLSESEMTDKANFKDFNFSELWTFGVAPDYKYPTIIGLANQK